MRRILVSFAVLIACSVTANAQLANYQAGPRLINGTQLNKMVAVVNGLTGNGTAQPGTFSVLTVTSASANALTVGLAGATNPALKVDASTASSATGLQVKSAAAAGGLAVAVISSGTDENLTLNAKGAGTVTINGTATGNIVMGTAVTGISASVTGPLVARSGTATPAAASAVSALTFGSAGIGVYWGTGAPSFSSVKGSLYIQTDGNSTSSRLYINNGTTTWIAITTAS